ncbi:MAG: hypothetical protein CMO80_09800 [Verrucomicrobiales bacterium]|nr:hypothetical protein [Verrucomicrobiales bacterium]|tara:strand:+ start:75 stop:377 length:303 start_codon:yes stop_codon:yes gene_type:complete
MNLDNIHLGTIRKIREITEDGKLEVDEVWNLSEYLTANPDAQQRWPGKKLWPIVEQVVEDNVVTKDELRMLAVEIADIEEMRSDISADRDTLTCKDVSDL